VRITSKGQVTIPHAVRERAGLLPHTEVDFVVEKVVDKVNKLREMSPLYEMAKAGIDLKSIQWAAH
jgi:AbrB family looped-hinge helix DNA binding protein